MSSPKTLLPIVFSDYTLKLTASRWLLQPRTGWQLKKVTIWSLWRPKNHVIWNTLHNGFPSSSQNRMYYYLFTYYILELGLAAPPYSLAHTFATSIQSAKAPPSRRRRPSFWYWHCIYVRRGPPSSLALSSVFRRKLQAKEPENLAALLATVLYNCYTEQSCHFFSSQVLQKNQKQWAQNPNGKRAGVERWPPPKQWTIFNHFGWDPRTSTSPWRRTNLEGNFLGPRKLVKFDQSYFQKNMWKC